MAGSVIQDARLPFETQGVKARRCNNTTLDFYSPEGRVRLAKRDADIPSFMTPPDHFALRAPARIGKYQADFSPQG